MRQRQFNLIVGAPGHGKSTFVSKLVDKCPDRNAIIYKEELNMDDAAFAKFPRCEFAKYKGGKVKISSFDIKYKPFMDAVYKHYRNGPLIIDDAGLYERDQVSEELNCIVTMRRHIGVDLICVYHGLSFLPIQQFPFINNIVLFHTTDSLYKGNRLPDVKRLQTAKERIAAQVARGNKYYHEVIKLS